MHLVVARDDIQCANKYHFTPRTSGETKQTRIKNEKIKTADTHHGSAVSRFPSLQMQRFGSDSLCERIENIFIFQFKNENASQRQLPLHVQCAHRRKKRKNKKKKKPNAYCQISRAGGRRRKTETCFIWTTTKTKFAAKPIECTLHMQRKPGTGTHSARFQKYLIRDYSKSRIKTEK